MVRGAPGDAGCHGQLAVVDNVCTRCWRWFPGTLSTCPACGALLTAADAAGATPPPPSSRPPALHAAGWGGRPGHWLRWAWR